MGMVLWHVTMSLDGFIAGTDDAMDWVFAHAGPNPAVDEVIRSTGALLVGRRSFDVGKKGGQALEAQKPYGGAWKGPQFVLTHTPPLTPVADDVTFLSGDLRSAVGAALAAARGKNVVVIGADIARQCVLLGLVDEILVHLAPVLLGDGVRLFEMPGSAPVALMNIGVEQAEEITNLRFRFTK